MADAAAPPRSMPHIPLEVQLKIAENLSSVQDARNVSLVCKELRDVGEIKIWREVDNGKPLSATALSARASTVDSNLRHVLAGIAAHPFRGECVRSVRIEPSDGGDAHIRARSLLSFLKLVAPQITHLSILPLTLPSDLIDEYGAELGCSHFLSVLDWDHITFPKVIKVQFGRGTKTLGPIPDWILRILKLDELEFSIDEISLKPSAADSAGFTSKNMRSFTVNQVNANRDRLSHVILSNLLRLAPNLSFVGITGDSVTSGKESALSGRFKRYNNMLIIRMNNWSDDEDYEESEYDDEAKASIISDQGVPAGGSTKDGEAEEISPGVIASGIVPGEGGQAELDGSIEQPGVDVPENMDTGGDFEDHSDSDEGRPEFRGWDAFLPPEDPFTADQGFGPGVSPMELQDGVMEVALEGPSGRFKIEDVQLSVDPTLQAISILTVPRLPLIETISLPISATPSEAGLLSSAFIRQLRRAPNLSEISMPFSNLPFPADYAPTGLKTGRHVRQHSWEEEGHYGAIVSHFARGASTQEDGFELWHVRVLSRSDESGQRAWKDLTRFKGKAVPMDVLKEAYEKAGIKIDHLMGRRFQSLGKGYKAWYFLYDWWSKARDREDEDDRLSDASFE